VYGIGQLSKGGKTEQRTFTVTGGMCPRCEGMGAITDIDLAQLFDDSKSLAGGALSIPILLIAWPSLAFCSFATHRSLRNRAVTSVLQR